MSIGEIMKSVPFYIFGIMLLIWILFPFYWTTLTSLKHPTEVIRVPPLMWVSEPYIENYILTFANQEFINGLKNTFLSTVIALLISLSLAIPASYGLARAGKGLRIRGKNSLYFTFITFRMLPVFVFIIPFFLLFRFIGIFDTIYGLVIAYMLIDIPLAVWFLTGFFEDIPWEIEDAYVLDGYPRSKAVLGVTIPMALPGIVAVSIICIIFTWSDLIFALSLTSKFAKTATYALLGNITFTHVKWGELCAQIIVLSLPLLAFSFYIQKYLVRGLTFGVVR
ncbi:MAG: carbohydrate ABC transporter permease [Desulfurococcaceae archaeon]